MQQATDFLEECHALSKILEPLSDSDFERHTQFKDWTINDVIGHLHLFNHAANLTLEDGDKFLAFYAPIAAAVKEGRTLVETQGEWLGNLSGRKLFEAWKAVCEETAANYAKADPKLRLKWAGPDMSAKSFITARQMETWAHGQEIFDLLGIARVDTDRIKNIAHLGVLAFGWTFENRKEKIPEPSPHVKLHAPSGAVWEWNESQDDNHVEGSATGFCQIVTQVRNVADTDVITTGETARQWMENAQCFAGKPETPPAPGTRFTQ